MGKNGGNLKERDEIMNNMYDVGALFKIGYGLYVVTARDGLT